MQKQSDKIFLYSMAWAHSDGIPNGPQPKCTRVYLHTQYNPAVLI